MNVYSIEHHTVVTLKLIAAAFLASNIVTVTAAWGSKGCIELNDEAIVGTLQSKTMSAEYPTKGSSYFEDGEKIVLTSKEGASSTLNVENSKGTFHQNTGELNLSVKIWANDNYGITFSDNDNFADTYTLTCSESAATIRHDFGGYGYSAIAWQQTSGATAVWLMSNGQLLQSGGLGSVPPNWQIVGQWDFNSDGYDDLLWRDMNSGTLGFWFMNGSQTLSTNTISGVTSNWTIVGIGDFNGDGHPDILWRDSNTGTVAVWLMNGLQIVQTQAIAVVGSNWLIAGIGDFNSDGNSDILWRDSNTGTVAVWFMYGVTAVSGNVAAAPTNWSIVGVGDFNGDGYSDILWRDSTTGSVAIWLMQVEQIMQTVGLGGVPSNWMVAETGDFNGDGYSDILWRDSNAGTVAIWFMNGSNGTSVASSASLGTVGLDWTIQGTNAD